MKTILVATLIAFAFLLALPFLVKAPALSADLGPSYEESQYEEVGRRVYKYYDNRQYYRPAPRYYMPPCVGAPCYGPPYNAPYYGYPRYGTRYWGGYGGYGGWGRGGSFSFYGRGWGGGFSW